MKDVEDLILSPLLGLEIKLIEGDRQKNIMSKDYRLTVKEMYRSTCAKINCRKPLEEKKEPVQNERLAGERSLERS